MTASKAPSNKENFLSSDKLIIPFESFIISSSFISLAFFVNELPLTSKAQTSLKTLKNLET